MYCVFCDGVYLYVVCLVELRNIPAAAVMEDYNTMDDPSCGSCASLQSSGTRDLSSEASLSHNSNTLGIVYRYVWWLTLQEDELVLVSWDVTQCHVVN